MWVSPLAVSGKTSHRGGKYGLFGRGCDRHDLSGWGRHYSLGEFANERSRLRGNLVHNPGSPAPFAGPVRDLYALFRSRTVSIVLLDVCRRLWQRVLVAEHTDPSSAA